MTDLQSKYIALHVGLFWAIGTFNIKKGDHVKIILDEQNMFEHFPTNNKRKDPIVEKRKQHINQIIIQRKLDISYENNCRQKIKTANEVKTNTARGYLVTSQMLLTITIHNQKIKKILVENH